MRHLAAPTPALILAFVGIVLLGFGAIFGLLAPASIENAADKVKDLTPSTAIQLADGQIGQRVLVQGRISERNRVQLDTFVAFIQEDLETDYDDDDDEEWVESRRVTPPLLLELPDGPLQVGNADYDLQLATIVEPSGDTRYRVVEPGDPAIALGTLTSSSDPPQIDAEFVALGTQDDYITAQRTSATIMRVLGIIFGAVGSALVLAALIVRRRS
jgi:hypothetical protein